MENGITRSNLITKIIDQVIFSLLLYTSYYRDRESGADYARERYYIVDQGRFASRDPIATVTNLYYYVANNPTNRIDPSGNVFWCLIPPWGWIVCGGALLFIAGCGSKAPDTSGREDMARQMPELKEGTDYKIIGPVSKDQNCFGYTIGANRWVEEEMDLNKNKNLEPNEVDAFYKKNGFERSKNCTPEPGKRKVALFVRDKPAGVHVAIESGDGKWRSKCSEGPAIEHSMEAMTKVYGRPPWCYEKADPTSNQHLKK